MHSAHTGALNLGPTAFRLGHRPALDGLRGVAVLLVVLGHIPALLPGWGTGFLPGGILGVEVFFVLSGFLITSLLLEERSERGRLSFRSFYIRRAYRLLPAVYVILIVQLIYSWLEGDPIGRDLAGLVSIAFYFFNWVAAYNGPVPYGLGQLWTLSVEEQFYIVWPIGLTMLIYTGRRNVVMAAMAVLIAVSGITRAAMIHTFFFLYVYLLTTSWVDALMIGALTAYLLHLGFEPHPNIRWAGLGGAAFILGLAFTADITQKWLYYGGFTLVALATAMIILSSLNAGGLLYQILAFAPLRFVGLLSYSLYLWHFAVFSWMERAWPHGEAVILLPAGLALTAVASLGSYFVVERPFLALKRARSRVLPVGSTTT